DKNNNISNINSNSPVGQKVITIKEESDNLLKISPQINIKESTFIPEVEQNNFDFDVAPKKYSEKEIEEISLLFDDNYSHSTSNKIDQNNNNNNNNYIINNNPHNLPKIASLYYINSNKLTREDLKDGRRIFNNRTELSGYS